MQLQNKEHQGFPPNHQELGEGQGRDCPSQPSAGATRPHTDGRHLSSRTVQQRNSAVPVTHPVELCYDSLGKLTQACFFGFPRKQSVRQGLGWSFMFVWHLCSGCELALRSSTVFCEFVFSYFPSGFGYKRYSNKPKAFNEQEMSPQIAKLG